MRIAISITLLLFQMAVFAAAGKAQGEEVVGFTISRYDVIGNTLLPMEDITVVLKPFTGENKTAKDVESARSALEKFYHQKGYPTVLVNIPEQSVENDSVQLQVVESQIRRVRITGNRYFTMQSILKKLPSFKPGEVLYLPKIQRELAQLNSNPDIKVAPVLVPGKTLGTIDVELKVKDKLPLHGSLELNNRSSHDTTDLRLNGLIRYDNLWQKEHSVTFQYQVSPEDTDEVNALAASYVLPAPWNTDHIFALYSVWSDSKVAFGEDFETVGKGYILGFRNVIPITPQGNYSHSLSLGLDYKDYEDKLSFQNGDDSIDTRLTYMPLSLQYDSSLRNGFGATRFNIGLNAAFRGLVTEQKQFEDKRYKSKGNYIYATAGVEHFQNLPYKFMFLIKCDGQISDQPLPSNEQYIAGGLKSVRGYKESEEAGDNAIHGTLELSYPVLAQKLGLPDWLGMAPNIFYDIAALRLLDPLEGQDQPSTMEGTGAGIRGNMTRFFEYEISWGVALKDTMRTKSGDQLIYFVVKGQF